MFPDQLIKAQSFIDLLGSNNIGGSATTSLRLAGKAPQLKLQSGKNSLKKQSEDVYQAMLKLKNDLFDLGIQLQIERIEQEPYMYQILVPNPRKNAGSSDNMEKQRIRLSLSGGQLMVKTGGGFTLFV